MNLISNVTDAPQDQCTVFSIVPFAIREFKPGLYPGQYNIDPCMDDREPARLLVNSSIHLVTIGGRKAPVRVTTSSTEIANSVVRDFLNGQLYVAEDAHPGICFVSGDVSVEKFKKDHIALYTSIREVQKRWLVLIVRRTSDDYAKFKSSKVVTDQARFAVKALGLPTPEWMNIEEVGLEHVSCPACGTKNNPSNAWCINCIQGGVKVIINETTLKGLKIQKENTAA